MNDTTQTNRSVNQQLCERLAHALQVKGLSIKKFAKLVGVSETTVTIWMNGDAEPRSALMPRIAGTLAVPMRWLMTGERKVEVPETSEARSPDPQSLLDEILAVQRITNACDDRLALIEKRLAQVAEEADDQFVAR